MNTNSRRLGNDRRDNDVGPPKGWRERRRSVERRYPDVQEISFAEWLSSMRTYHARPQRLAA